MKRETQSVPEARAPVDSDDLMCVGTWVAVEDDLPAFHEHVLVFPGRHMGVRTETYDFDKESMPESGWHVETDGEGFKIDRVTHWARIHAPGERDQKPDVEA